MNVKTLTLAALAFAPASGTFADVPWGNHDGTASFFSWENGAGANGRLFDPSLVNDEFFYFRYAWYRGAAEPGRLYTTTDAALVDLHVANPPVQKFRAVAMDVYLQYAVYGVGASVSANVEMILTDLHNPTHLAYGYATTPVFHSGGGYEWLPLTVFLREEDNWTDLHVSASCTLISDARGFQGGTGFIDVVQFYLAPAIPGPGSLTTAALGAFLVLPRRRR